MRCQACRGCFSSPRAQGEQIAVATSFLQIQPEAGREEFVSQSILPWVGQKEHRTGNQETQIPLSGLKGGESWHRDVGSVGDSGSMNSPEPLFSSVKCDDTYILCREVLMGESLHSTWRLVPSPATQDIDTPILRSCSATVPHGGAVKGHGGPPQGWGIRGGRKRSWAEEDAGIWPKSRHIMGSRSRGKIAKTVWSRVWGSIPYGRYSV